MNILHSIELGDQDCKLENVCVFPRHRLFFIYVIIIDNTIFKTILGDPAQLHFLIREGKLEMTKLGKYDAATLKTFCKDCDIPVGGKSMVIRFSSNVYILYMC